MKQNSIPEKGPFIVSQRETVDAWLQQTDQKKTNKRNKENNSKSVQVLKFMRDFIYLE